MDNPQQQENKKRKLCNIDKKNLNDEGSGDDSNENGDGDHHAHYDDEEPKEDKKALIPRTYSSLSSNVLKKEECALLKSPLSPKGIRNQVMSKGIRNHEDVSKKDHGDADNVTVLPSTTSKKNFLNRGCLDSFFPAKKGNDKHKDRHDNMVMVVANENPNRTHLLTVQTAASSKGDEADFAMITPSHTTMTRSKSVTVDKPVNHSSSNLPLLPGVAAITPSATTTHTTTNNTPTTFTFDLQLQAIYQNAIQSTQQAHQHQVQLLESTYQTKLDDLQQSKMDLVHQVTSLQRQVASLQKALGEMRSRYEWEEKKSKQQVYYGVKRHRESTRNQRGVREKIEEEEEEATHCEDKDNRDVKEKKEKEQRLRQQHVTTQTTNTSDKKASRNAPKIDLKKEDVVIELDDGPDSPPTQVHFSICVDSDHEESVGSSSLSPSDTRIDKGDSTNHHTKTGKPQRSIQESFHTMEPMPPTTKTLPTKQQQRRQQHNFSNPSSPSIQSPIIHKTPTTPTCRPASKSDNHNQYKYKEVIRGRKQREKLHGHDCECCKGFYDAILSGKGAQVFNRDELIQQHSRHRSRYAQVESTPTDFWEMSFADSIAERKSKAVNSDETSSEAAEEVLQGEGNQEEEEGRNILELQLSSLEEDDQEETTKSLDLHHDIGIRKEVNLSQTESETQIETRSQDLFNVEQSIAY